MNRNTRRTGTALAILASVSALAATFEISVKEAEARTKAAEHRLSIIKGKSAQAADQVRAAYADAAAKNNAWVEAVCSAIEQGAATAPDIGSLAEPAAISLILWVSAGDNAVGTTPLSSAIAEASKKNIIRNIADVAAEAWKKDRRGDPEKRKKAAATLRDRLLWKTFDEAK